jgi:hypothetical protein
MDHCKSFSDVAREQGCQQTALYIVSVNGYKTIWLPLFFYYGINMYDEEKW